MKSLESATQVPTGVEPIDSALGGLELGRVHVIYGDLETGKSTVAARFIAEGLIRGEACVFVVRYGGDAAVRALADLGYDCREDLRSGRLVLFEYATDLVDQLARVDGLAPVLDELGWLLEEASPRRIAFDSADFIFSIQYGYGFPMQIPAFTSWLAETGAATLLVVEERITDRIVQSFRANAPTVIHATTRKFGDRTEYHLAFEKSAVKAPPRRYGLGPDGFVTLEIYGAQARTLPLPASPARRRPPGDRTGQLTVPEEAVRFVAEAAAEPPPRPAPPAPPAPAPARPGTPRAGRPRVLVIDEDRVACQIVQRALSPECDVAVEPDGISGLARLNSFDPDLVLLETKLPLVDGLTICRQIREISAVPIAVVTGTHVAAHERVASAEAGADLFLAKPVNLRELAVRARQMIARFRGLPPPTGAALTAADPDPLVAYEQFIARLDAPVEARRALVGCRLDASGAAEAVRVVDLVRAELRPDDMLAYEPARRAVVALVAPEAAGELAGLLARRAREHAGLDLAFWSAPVENGDGARVLAEQLGDEGAAR